MWSPAVWQTYPLHPANRLQVVLDGVDSVRKLDSCSMALVPLMQECPSWHAAGNATSRMEKGNNIASKCSDFRKPRNIHLPTEIFPIIIRALYDGGSLLQVQLAEHGRSMMMLAMAVPEFRSTDRY